MIKNKFLYIAVLFFYLSSNVQTAESQGWNEKNFEGWVWSKSLNFKLSPEEKSFVDADNIHQELSSYTHKFLKDIKSQSKNIALLRLGFVLEDEKENKSYKILPCFNDYIFYSGEENEDIFSSEEELKKGVKLSKETLHTYTTDEPRNYSFLLEDMRVIYQKRFHSIQDSCLKENTYVINIMEINNFNYDQKINNIGNVREILKNVKDNQRALKERHSDSEQKILNFIEESLSNIPFYWNINFPELSHQLINLLKEYYVAMQFSHSLPHTPILQKLLLDRAKKNVIMKTQQFQSKKNDRSFKELQEVMREHDKLEQLALDIKKTEEAIIKAEEERDKNNIRNTLQKRVKDSLRKTNRSDRDNDTITKKSVELTKKIGEFKAKWQESFKTSREFTAIIKAPSEDNESFFSAITKCSMLASNESKQKDRKKEIIKETIDLQNQKKELDDIIEKEVQKEREARLIIHKFPSLFELKEEINVKHGYLNDLLNGVKKKYEIIKDKNSPFSFLDQLIEFSALFLKLTTEGDTLKLLNDESFNESFLRLTEIENFKTDYPSLKRVPDQKWVNSLFQHLKKNNNKILGFVLHFHSRYDVCHSCGPSITRECERSDGFVGKLKSICTVLNDMPKQNPSVVTTSQKTALSGQPSSSALPFCRVLFSCNEVRDMQSSRPKVEEEQYIQELIDIDPAVESNYIKTIKQPIIFYQSIIPSIESLQ